jgi:hypothetical protein
MSSISNIYKQKKIGQRQKAYEISRADNIISKQVFTDRRNEIHEYLKLFGYKADKTIIQVHVAGFFRGKGQQTNQKEKARQAATIKRYGGASFVIVGRTHDPSIMENVIKPKKRNPIDTSPGYIGYLWKNKDSQKRAPHQIIPLDFTPINLPYPTEWKNIFATKGFMLALHVPSSFARYKNRLTRALYRISKSGVVDVKKKWTFLNELKQFGISNVQQTVNGTDAIKANYLQDNYRNTVEYYRNVDSGGGKQPYDGVEDSGSLIKRKKMVKGQISNEEYQELRKAIGS